MIEKKCKQTGQPIISGRSDKKFINDKARSKYHYQKRKEKNLIFESIDKQLHLNHDILERFFEYSKGVKGIPLDILEKKGFDPLVYFGSRIDLDTALSSKIYYSYRYQYTYNKKEKKIYIKERKRKIKSRF